MEVKRVIIDQKINLIQQLRLIHALSETEYSISIPEDEVFKFALLNKKFGMQVNTNQKEGLKLSSFVSINHKLPLVTVGNMTNTLIFPHSIVKYCKSIWCINRNYRFTFTGLVTQSRRKILHKWIKQNFDSNFSSLPNEEKLLFRIKKKIFLWLRLDDTIRKTIGDFTLWSSSKGRRYPTKPWDEEYYSMLAKSKFVLCPSGDFIWSYRFFEAILCGAIPVIEEYCNAYEGFKFYYMNDDAKTLLWSMDDAEYNYNLCVERITFSKELLNTELDRLASVSPTNIKNIL